MKQLKAPDTVATSDDTEELSGGAIDAEFSEAPAM
jgi:hypothetical protein